MADFSQNGHEPGTFEHRQKEDLGSLTDVLGTLLYHI